MSQYQRLRWHNSIFVREIADGSSYKPVKLIRRRRGTWG